MDKSTKTIIYSVLAISLVLVVLLFRQSIINKNQGSIQRVPTPKDLRNTVNEQENKKVMVGATTVEVDVADSSQEHNQGLSGRSELSEDQGMLFVFPQENVTPAFWMKDMLIDLDIIWINDGVITQITDNAQKPAPGAADDQLELYLPNDPIDYVLEVNSEFVENNGIEVGDPVAIYL